MRVVEVDERDSSWEDHGPVFRVYLHDSGGSDELGGSATCTFDVSGADFLEVLAWAQEQAGERRVYAIALVRERPPRVGDHPYDEHRRGLVWLLGCDGNDVPSTPEIATAQRGMLARRGKRTRTT